MSHRRLCTSEPLQAATHTKSFLRCLSPVGKRRHAWTYGDSDLQIDLVRVTTVSKPTPPVPLIHTKNYTLHYTRYRHGLRVPGTNVQTSWLASAKGRKNGATLVRLQMVVRCEPGSMNGSILPQSVITADIERLQPDIPDSVPTVKYSCLFQCRKLYSHKTYQGICVSRKVELRISAIESMHFIKLAR